MTTTTLLEYGNIEDLATLNNLDEKTLIAELNARYKLNRNYVYIGDILLSMNPFKEISIYGESYLKEYNNVKHRQLHAAHLYAMSDKTYQFLRRTYRNQSIIINGEAGTGKTETAKFLIKHLAYMSCSSSSHNNNNNRRLSYLEGERIENKIIDSNPLLEAFGNAKTIANDNSSRFGKYIELKFDLSGELIGAVINEYMLEKSRIVASSDYESNFHIFYYLYAGLNDNDKRIKYGLSTDDPSKHRILTSASLNKKEVAVNNNNNKMKWQMILDCIKKIGLSEYDIINIICLLTSIIHVTDIEFLVDMQHTEGTYIVNESSIVYAAQLLGIDENELAACLISNWQVVNNEEIITLKNVNQAENTRDTLAVQLYCRLFSWIVRKINVKIMPERRFINSLTIGILDIAGFENNNHFPDTDNNGFEQLCINSANEHLQLIFNQCVFLNEIEEYQKEKIFDHVDMEKKNLLKSYDNRLLIEFLMKRPLGLFDLIDEESRFPNGSDSSMLEKINKQQSCKTKKRKTKPLTFSLNHYAAVIEYNVDGFLKKNQQLIGINLLNCLKRSRRPIISDLFTNSDLTSSNRFTKTLSTQFTNSLVELSSKLKATQPSFIRCIKTNDLKRPNFFDMELVRKQIKYTGVMDIIKIRRNGYSIRIKHEDFLSTYKIIAFPLTSSTTDAPKPSMASSLKILKKANLNQSNRDYHVGKTKVYLKYFHGEILVGLLDAIDWKIVQCQKFVRRFLARKHTKWLRAKAKAEMVELRAFSKQFHNLINNQYTEICQQNRYDATRSRTTNKNDVSIELKSKHRQIYQATPLLALKKKKPVPSPRMAATSVKKEEKESEETLKFLDTILDETLARYTDIDVGIWCKVYYMERNQVVAKYYVREKSFLIDASNEQYEGKVIGLGLLTKNNDESRDKEVEMIREKIGTGLRFNRENDGSLTVKLTQNSCPVFIKGFDKVDSIVSNNKINPLTNNNNDQQDVYLFDMRLFKQKIAQELSTTINTTNELGNDSDAATGAAIRNIEKRLQRLTVSRLAFEKDEEVDFYTPVWLAIVNFCGMDALGSERVLKEIQVSMKTNEKTDAIMRRNWAVMNLRPKDERQLEGIYDNNVDNDDNNEDGLDDKKKEMIMQLKKLSVIQKNSVTGSKKEVVDKQKADRKEWAKQIFRKNSKR